MRTALVVTTLVALTVGALGSVALADEAGVATARQHEDEGRYADAAAAYRATLESSTCPYDVHVRYQAAALRGGGSVEDLVAWYDALIEKEPESLEAKLHRLRLDAASARTKPLEQLKKAHSDSADVLVELGRAYVQIGDPKKAVSVLKKAFATVPASRSDVALLLAEARQQSGDTKGAIKDLELLLTARSELQEGWVQLATYHLQADEFENASRAANKALVVRPSYVAALLARAEAERGMGKREEALATLTTAQRVNPTDAGVLVALADAVAAEETEAAYTRACELYQQVLTADEENISALHGFGWVREREEKYEEALDLYERLAALRPDDAMGHNSVGVVLFKMGQVSRAQSKFKLAADKDKDFVAALANLGMTYDAQARYSLAIKTYDKVLKQKEHKENLRVIVACAFDHESLGAYSKASKMLEQAHEIRPDDADICVWLGDNQYFQKKWKPAEKWYTKSIERDEESFFGWRGLGYTLIQLRKFDDAVKALEKARRLDDKDPYVPLALGDLYMDEVEDIEKAIECFKEYVDRGGDDPAIPELITELEESLK